MYRNGRRTYKKLELKLDNSKVFLLPQATLCIDHNEVKMTKKDNSVEHVVKLQAVLMLQIVLKNTAFGISTRRFPYACYTPVSTAQVLRVIGQSVCKTFMLKLIPKSLRRSPSIK